VRNGGIRKETRSSALWGTGNRGGESRSSALWGKGGRGAVTALAAMLVVSVPFAASAPKHARKATQVTLKKTWISPGLVKSAKQHPNRYVRRDHPEHQRQHLAGGSRPSPTSTSSQTTIAAA
jgi:hypothetical protein